MKRIVIVTVVVLAAVALAFAGEPSHEHHTEGELAAYLQLTPAQSAAWESARLEFKNANMAVFARHRELSSQIETALKAPSPDACGVGALMVEQQKIVAQIRAARQAHIEKVTSVLTPEQRAKYDAFVAAEKLGRERE